MKILAHTLTLSIALLSSGVAASENRATQEAQRKFWDVTERIAFTLPGDSSDIQRIIPSPAIRNGAASNSPSANRAEIAPSLFAERVLVSTGNNGAANAIDFDLSGSCIPFSSVRKRYPNLLVISQGASELEWNAFGTQIGESVVSFWFKGKAFGCMRRVEITPAAETLSRLNLD